MNQPQENRFYHFASQFFRDEFPEKTKSYTDEELKCKIDKGLIAAHKNGFSTEVDAISFIDLDWRFEGELTRNDPPESITQIFDSELSAEEKIDCLRDLYCRLEWKKCNDCND